MEPADTGGNLPRVLRNASLLLSAQLLAAPIGILINAIAARKLGAAEYGFFYQAGTFAAFAFLFVEWGQPAVLTGQVAMHRERAGELLGSGLAFRACTSIAALLVVPLVAWLAGYDQRFLVLLVLALLGGMVGTLSGACQDVFRGYERTDFAAASYLGWQVLGLLVAVPLLLAGGNLEALMVAQVLCGTAVTVFVLWMTPRMHVPPLVVRRETVIELARRGHPFVVFALVLAVQPLVDAALLSRMADAETMGWYGTARKLIGVLVFPASALVGALYPTLCRLHQEGGDAFRRTSAEALHAVSVVAVPAALGCLMFPQLGVAIFGREGYAPAADDLRVLAPWLLLVFFSMPIGSCLTAAGRQGAWTLVLLAGALAGVLLDPFLIPWFARHYGNGGLGVCVAALVAEAITVTGAVSLLPRGVLAGIGRGRLLAATLSGAVMAAVALLGRPLNDWVAAALASLAYAACLQLTGGVDFRQLREFVTGLRRQARAG